MTTTPLALNFRGNLEGIVAELERQKATKLDFCADARTLAIMHHDGSLHLASTSAQTGEFLPRDGFPLAPAALEQLGQRVSPEIPTRFLRSLSSERPVICAELLSNLMVATGRRYFIRSLDSRIRAILSDRYRVIDNYDFAFTALETIKENNGTIIECSLSDTRMRLSFTSPTLCAAAPNTKNGTAAPVRQNIAALAPHTPGSHSFAVGSALANGMVVGNVYPYFTISNSETGNGGCNVEQGIFEPRCSNGAILEKIIGRVHLGEKLDGGIYSEETQAADSKAIMLKARDAIRAALTGDTFRKMVDLANTAQSDEIKAPSSACANVIKNAGLPDSMIDSLLSHFIKDYDQTRYGLSAAVARLAQDQDADTGADLEALAGHIIKSPALLTA